MKKIIGISLVLAAVTLFSCQDEKIDLATDDAMLSEKAAQISLNEVSMESALTETEYEIDFYANAFGRLFMQQRKGQMWRWSDKLRYGAQQCPNLNIEAEDGDFPKTITLDYGEGTELRNGKVLSGVITIEITAPRTSPEYQRNVTYTNFGVDNMVINGTSVVTVDREEETFRTFVNDMEITLADGTEVTRHSERSWQWIEGMDTELDQSDDVIQITGFAQVSTSTGDEYKKEIIEPLIRSRDCRFIVSGIVEITLNEEVSTLDYGDGTCDALAILTQEDEEIEVDLTQYQKGNGNRNGNQGGNGMAMGGGTGNQNGNQTGSQDGSGNQNGNHQGNGNHGGNNSGSQNGSGNQNGNGGNGNQGGGMNG